MIEKLEKILKDYTNGQVPDITPESVLTTDLGLNSFELFEIVCIIEEEFEITIPDRVLPTLVTVQDVLTYLESAV